MTEKLPNFMTVKQFVEKHPAFTAGGMRSLIFNASGDRADPDGFARCIRRIGRKVLIDERGFFDCLDNQQNKEEVR